MITFCCQSTYSSIQYHCTCWFQSIQKICTRARLHRPCTWKGPCFLSLLHSSPLLSSPLLFSSVLFSPLLSSSLPYLFLISSLSLPLLFSSLFLISSLPYLFLISSLPYLFLISSLLFSSLRFSSDCSCMDLAHAKCPLSFCFQDGLNEIFFTSFISFSPFFLSLSLSASKITWSGSCHSPRTFSANK